jgi:hypothetical protein
MAFTYDLTAINNFNSVCFKGDGDDTRLNPVTHTLVWGMLLIDLSAITEANCAEVYARLKVAERIYSENGIGVNLQDVVNHIGLKTNASNYTSAEWLKKIKDGLKRDLERCHSDAKRTLAETEAVPA